VRTKLLTDSVDAYVLRMPSPVNKRKRSLHPVVRERQALVGQLQSILRDLGLERRVKDANLARRLADMHEQQPGDATTKRVAGYTAPSARRETSETASAAPPPA
jgi:hypothetical protein